MQQQIEVLSKWKAERERQQISYPLDSQSREILAKYFMNITDLYTYEIVGAAAHPYSIYIGRQGNSTFQVQQQRDFKYSVNVTNNTLTTTRYFVNDTAVLLATDDAYPAPFAVNTTYYVVNTAGSTFQLSATVGGAVINITTLGTGSQYISEEL